jgi:hypothetical protein
MKLINRFELAAAFALVFALNAFPASAINLNFDQLVDGGTLTYSGTAGTPLTGTDIFFQQVTGIDTPLNSGVTLTCQTPCLLNFATGGNTTEGVVYQWNGGGTFVLTGTLLGPGNVVIASGTLLTGTFTTAVGVAAPGDPSQFTFNGFGIDDKNPDLIAYFGLQNYDFSFANTEISSPCAPGANGSLSCSVNEADLVNTATPVTEPASMLLFGLGLAGLGFWGRKRLN